MRTAYDNPYWKIKTERGTFPSNLTFGFENEVELAEVGDWDDEEDEDGLCCSIDDAIEDVPDFNGFLYAKEDCSLREGVEINSNPFDFNWFLKNTEILNFTSVLAKNGIAGSNRCGFHIHINKAYFTDKHLRRFFKLIYNNPSFWKRVSQRGNTTNLMDYANLLDVRDTIRRRFGTYPRRIAWKHAQYVIRGRHTGHYSALDINASDNTLEFRCFRGTTNPNLIRTYLETMLAAVMYSQETPFNKITQRGFIEYVYSKKETYPFVVSSNILKGQCKYRWNHYQPLIEVR